MKKLLLTLPVLALVMSFSLSSQAKGKKKSPYNIAKKECLAADSNLAGKALRMCIKGKRK